MMPTEALTTLAATKVYLDEDGSDDDTLLGAILDGVEVAVGRFCRPLQNDGTNHPLASYSDTEYYSGEGMDELWLRRFPVTAITSVHVDQNGYGGHGSSPFPASTEWTLGTDFVPGFDYGNLRNLGRIVSLRSGASGVFGNSWPIGTQNVKVIYTAGYATTPDDLETAIHMLVQQTWKAQQSGQGDLPKSERHSRYAYTLLTEGKTKPLLAIREILMGYRDKRG